MRVRVRGWDRNHGWRELARVPVRSARQVGHGWRMSANEVIIERSPSPAHETGGGATHIYFKAEVLPALNGNYMFGISLTKYDVARLFKEMTTGCPTDYVLTLLAEVGSEGDDE